MPKCSWRSIIATLFLLCAAGFAKDVDYSKEGAVIQALSRRVTFSSDGTWQSLETAVIRVQSDSGVQQFGVLSFPYDRDNQKVELAYLRVRKPDGRTVVTPDDAIQDVSSEISKAAPTYSDLREKQIPVKALGVGDVIEYQVRSMQTKPEIPGQFWYLQNFVSNGVVLNETLEIEVPSDKYVNVVSAALKPEIRETPGHKTYFWKTAQLEPTSQEADKSKKARVPDSVPSVRLTTFKTWYEIGRWYAGLQQPRAAVTPAIQAKADELIRGSSTEEEKARAIYNFVSTKFRYVSLSFGVGRYQPHTAEEVLANEYGDCKDKHTLFAALLKAAGIEAWPALIGAGIKLDPDVPSPAQFNHLITVIPNRQGYLWLDTTPEVAPYGLLQMPLRDQKALVIPTNAPARLVTTPADPPFGGTEVLDVQATLSQDGTLTGHFDFTVRGDEELLLRSMFHEVPPARWLDLVQQLARTVGFGGTVSNLDADSPGALAKPFHYSFDYTRANYPDWQDRRITPPLFPLLTALSDDAEKPTESFSLGALGEFNLRAKINLPKDYSAEVPADTKIQAEFANYDSTYSVKDGVLTASRRLVIRQSKIQTTAWDAYRKFAKQVADDHDRFIKLNELSAAVAIYQTEDNAEAAGLISQAFQAGGQLDYNTARDYLARAERLNPKQKGLWAAYGALYLSSNEPQKGMEALQKEIQFHPENAFAYQTLAQIQEKRKEPDEAIETLRSGFKAVPDDRGIAAYLCRLLMKEKRYEDVRVIIGPIAEKTKDRSLQAVLAEALLRSGHKEEGLAAAKKLVEGDDAWALNDVAYYLADTKTDLSLAKEYAVRAVAKSEDESSKLALPSPKNADLGLMNSLAAEWDTLGWVYYQTGDLTNAEKYAAASWDLCQRGAVGDHLGQIYLRQGKEQLAIHTWQLALAADPSLNETRERLRSAGASAMPERPTLKRNVRSFALPTEELGKLRLTNVPALPKQEASAEFFVLFSLGKVENVQFIGGRESLREAGTALKTAEFQVRLPDTNAEKILRRGILSCSTYTTPSCQFVMLLPATSTSARARARPATSVEAPTLATKSEPEYSPAARQAKVEGTVTLSIMVDENGVPQNIKVVKSVGFGLDEKATECVSQWRFKPGTKDGTAVKTEARVEVNFRLVNSQ